MLFLSTEIVPLQVVGSDKFEQLALGQGQTEPALNALRAAAKTGTASDCVCCPSSSSCVTHVCQECMTANQECVIYLRLVVTAEEPAPGAGLAAHTREGTQGHAVSRQLPLVLDYGAASIVPSHASAAQSQDQL